MQLSKILQSTKNIEKQIMTLAEHVLEKLFLKPISTISLEKLKFYSDVLIIYSNVNPDLPQMITNWLFKIGE